MDMLLRLPQGVATTYKGNYTQYIRQNEEQDAQQWAAWEKQQKEINRQVMRWAPSLPNAGHEMLAHILEVLT